MPQTAYTIQHGLYKGFVAPVALYAVLGAVLLRGTGKKIGDGGEEVKP